MREAAARQVLLVQAYDSASPPTPIWTDDDRAWATRLAVQTAGAGDAARARAGLDAPSDADADAEGFVIERARHALQRIVPRDPLAAAWLARPLWRGAWVAAAAVVGLALGLLSDAIGSSQRINLLAPPIWAVLAWNLVVYALLVGHALAGLARHPTGAGPLRRLAERLLHRRERWSRDRLAAGASAALLRAFAGRWLSLTAPLSAARGATLLHAAAAAVALGLIAGLYLRGLVLDYRAVWESTFLSAQTARALLAALLAPAAALSGIALPDAAAFETMRVAHGSSVEGAPAAPWIHLYALTLLLSVVLPRSALACAGGLRAAWLARHLAVPLHEPYFRQLLRQRGGGAARVVVLPYAATPGAQAALALRDVLARVFGEGVEVQIAATVAFGAEDDGVAAPAGFAGSALAVLLFDLAATPEVESQGRFCALLAEQAGPAVALLLLVDEAAFIDRFGSGARLDQRREAWRRFADAASQRVVFVRLDVPDLADAERAVRQALAAPALRAA